MSIAFLPSEPMHSLQIYWAAETMEMVWEWRRELYQTAIESQWVIRMMHPTEQLSYTLGAQITCFVMTIVN